jgi:hypothetical protein
MSEPVAWFDPPPNGSRRAGKLSDLVKQAWDAAHLGQSVALIVLKLPAPQVQRILQDFAMADDEAVSVRRITGACYKFRGGGKLELKAAPKQLRGQAAHFIVDNPHD